MRNAVADVLAECIENFEIQAKQTESMQKAADAHADMLRGLQQRLDDLYALEAAQWNEKAKGAMPDRVFERLNADVLQEIEATQKSIAAAEANPPSALNIEERLAAFREALNCLTDASVPVHEKNRLLKECFKRLTFDRRRKDFTRGRRWGEPYPVTIQSDSKV